MQNVVVGAGPLGLAVARLLAERGVAVKLLSRTGRIQGAPPGVETDAVDASNAEELSRAATGAAVIYHCATPPYDRWPELHPPLMAGILGAAERTGAKLVYGDNVYAYGPVDGPIREDLPERPVGPKGRVRAEVAERLLDAHARGRIRGVIGRASDFYGPWARQAIIGERVVAPALGGRAAELIGNIDLPHTHIYIEDFARGLITLAEREESLGQVWHVPSAPTRTTRELVDMAFREAGTSSRYRIAGPFLVRFLGLFNPMMRELSETLYQVTRPFVVDHSKFERAFGAQTTPHEEAIRRTVEWYRAQPTA